MSSGGESPLPHKEIVMSENVDFVINDDGTPSQDNDTGVDIEGNGLGHSDDSFDLDDSLSDCFNDDF